MSNLPTIGFDDRYGVKVDLDRLVASRLLIQANSGGGKSWALRYVLERTHGSIPHLVLDSEGEFSTLRERYPYVLAGKGGDVPADPKVAKLLCRRLVELGASAVIDLYDLKLSDRRRFVRLFLEELMHLPRKLWTPTLVVIDEAHRYCPEKGSSESADAVITLCTQGRKRGYAAVLATQRLSKLNKDAAAELLNVLIGRTGLDIDMKRAADILGFSSKNERNALRDLAPGEFFAFGPAIGSGVQKVRTGDVDTTHPEPGKIGEVAPPAPAEVKALLEQLTDLPEEAEEEERTIAALEQRTRELERDLRAARKEAEQSIEPAALADLKQENAALHRAIAETADEVDERLEELVETATEPLRDRLSVLETSIEEGRRVAEALVGVLTVHSENGDGEVELPSFREEIEARLGDVPPAPARVNPVPALRAARATRSSPPPEDLPAAQVRILDALATLETIGVEEVTRTNLALFSRQSPKSSAYQAHVAQLEQAGLVRYPKPGLVALTAEGAAIGSPEFEISTPADLHAAWLDYLEDAQARILRVLLDAYPTDIDRSELAELAGQSPRSSAYQAHVAQLAQLGAVDYPEPGRVRATELLFPEGLR